MQVWNLVGDIGGTNMRLAAIFEGQITDTRTYPTKGGMHLNDAVDDFLRHVGSQPGELVIAAAGPIKDGAVTLTNSGMRIDSRELATRTMLGTAHLLNDFAAAAWSLVTLDDKPLTRLAGDDVFAQEPRLILGPGTGLGVAGLVWRNQVPAVVPGEGGHIRIAPDCAEDIEVFAAFARLAPEFRMGDGWALEAEAFLSGTGIPILYRACRMAMGQEDSSLDGAEVFQFGRTGEDPAAALAVRLVRKYLAGVAGDLAVVFNATGGVFLCGGVASSNPWLFDDTFLDHFRAGGRTTPLRESYSLHLVTGGAFGILGGRNFLRYRIPN